MSDGGPVDEAFFWGDVVEERFFDGVKFRVTIEDDEFVVSCEEDDYTKQFNMEHFYALAKEIVKDYTEDGEEPFLFLEGSDVWVVERE